MPSILGANSVTGDFITNSLSLNNDDGAYLSITRDGNQSKQIATFSTWTKMGPPSQDHILFGGASDNDNRAYLYFSDPSGYVGIFERTSGSAEIAYASNAKFQDPAAWYHVVVVFDTTNGTAGNRFKMFINGRQYTDWGTSTAPDQNHNLQILKKNNMTVGAGFSSGGVNTFGDGYLADFHYIDGTALDASYFGETNDNGVWVPKEYSGTYGNNGFHLEFKQTGTSQNSSGIGADTSGNDNHLAVTNLAATDVGIDTPQNNYCTINPVYADDGNNMVAADFSEGNRKQLTTVDGWKFGRGTFLLEAGKWYAEVKMTEAGGGQVGNFGIVPSQGGVALGNTDDNDVFEGIRVGLGGSDTILQKLDTGTGSNIFTDFASGNTAMLAFDLDNDKIWIGREGTWYNDNNASTTLDPSNHDIALPSVALGWVFGLGMSRNGSDNVTFEYNWGNPAHAISSGNSDADGHGNFEFAVPSGFFAVNSKNLAEYG